MSQVYTQIYQVIENLPIWEKIQMGHVTDRCHEYAAAVYDHLSKPENSIPGLSLAVVESWGIPPDHAWLIAHHADTGYFMIDPTVGQFIRRRDADGTLQPYGDVFIGTYDELRTIAQDTQHFELQGNFDRNWPPAIRYDTSGKAKGPCYRPADMEIWHGYPFPVHHDVKAAQTLEQHQERLGLWAASMERGQANWRQVLKEHWRIPETTQWPDPSNAPQMTFYTGICEARDRYAQSGFADREGGNTYASVRKA